MKSTCILAGGVLALSSLFASDLAPLKTDQDKRSYAAGMALGLGMKAQAEGLELNSDLVARGFSDVLRSNQTLLTMEEARELSANTFAGALFKARGRALEINCQNNLKQIGLAFRLWSLDNGDEFPFNVKAAKGGSAELCARDAGGFEKNPLPHFLVLSNELFTPKLLTCPADESRVAVTTWTSLTTSNITYRLRSGTNVNELRPDEILVQCPIHKTVLRCDGSVAKP